MWTRQASRCDETGALSARWMTVSTSFSMAPRAAGGGRSEARALVRPQPKGRYVSILGMGYLDHRARARKRQPAREPGRRAGGGSVPLSPALRGEGLGVRGLRLVGSGG